MSLYMLNVPAQMEEDCVKDKLILFYVLPVHVFLFKVCTYTVQSANKFWFKKHICLVSRPDIGIGSI